MIKYMADRRPVGASRVSIRDSAKPYSEDRSEVRSPSFHTDWSVVLRVEPDGGRIISHEHRLCSSRAGNSGLGREGNPPPSLRVWAISNAQGCDVCAAAARNQKLLPQQEELAQRGLGRSHS